MSFHVTQNSFTVPCFKNHFIYLFNAVLFISFINGFKLNVRYIYAVLFIVLKPRTLQQQKNSTDLASVVEIYPIANENNIRTPWVETSTAPPNNIILVKKLTVMKLVGKINAQPRIQNLHRQKQIKNHSKNPRQKEQNRQRNFLFIGTRKILHKLIHLKNFRSDFLIKFSQLSKNPL